MGRNPLIPKDVKRVLQAARRGFMTKSTIARDEADAVAEAASRGWISTRIDSPSGFGREWLITPSGLVTLDITSGGSR